MLCLCGGDVCGVCVWCVKVCVWGVCVCVSACVCIFVCVAYIKFWKGWPPLGKLM